MFISAGRAAEGRKSTDRRVQEKDGEFRGLESRRQGGMCRGSKSFSDNRSKDQSFVEEGEWRLISTPRTMRQMDFRLGTSTLVPYFKFKLENRRDEYLESVRVGPSPQRESAVRAVRMRLFYFSLPILSLATRGRGWYLPFTSIGLVGCLICIMGHSSGRAVALFFCGMLCASLQERRLLLRIPDRLADGLGKSAGDLTEEGVHQIWDDEPDHEGAASD
jgi:hypothetical protein